MLTTNATRSRAHFNTSHHSFEGTENNWTPTSVSVLNKRKWKIRKIGKVGNIPLYLRQTKRIFRRTIWWNISTRVARRIYFPFFRIKQKRRRERKERENLQKRRGLESCTRRLILESDQPSLFHCIPWPSPFPFLSFFLSFVFFLREFDALLARIFITHTRGFYLG